MPYLSCLIFSCHSFWLLLEVAWCFFFLWQCTFNQKMIVEILKNFQTFVILRSWFFRKKYCVVHFQPKKRINVWKHTPRTKFGKTKNYGDNEFFTLLLFERQFCFLGSVPRLPALSVFSFLFFCESTLVSVNDPFLAMAEDGINREEPAQKAWTRLFVNGCKISTTEHSSARSGSSSSLIGFFFVPLHPSWIPWPSGAMSVGCTSIKSLPNWLQRLLRSRLATAPQAQGIHGGCKAGNLFSDSKLNIWFSLPCSSNSTLTFPSERHG